MRGDRSLGLSVGAAHALVHTAELTYAALLSRVGDEFGAGLLGLGVLANVGAFAYGFGALPAGILVDRWGSRTILQVTFAGSVAGALGVALAPSVEALAAALALLGLAIGLYHPAGMAYLAQAARERGTAMAYHGVMGNLGIAAAPLLAVGAAEALGWRWAYVLLAALAAASTLLVRSLPRAPARRTAAAAAPEGGGRRWSRVALPLLLTYAAYVLSGFVYRGGLTFLPLRIEENVGFSLLGLGPAVAAASFATAALLCGAVGQILGGRLLRRRPPEQVALPLALALLPALVLTGALTGPAMAAAGGAFTFFYFAAQPVWNVLIAEYTPDHLMGRSFGVSFFATFGLGSFAASFAGYFAGRWGTDAVFYALAGTSAATAVLAAALLGLARARRRTPAAAGAA